jgi:hypothetical protein
MHRRKKSIQVARPALRVTRGPDCRCLQRLSVTALLNPSRGHSDGISDGCRVLHITWCRDFDVSYMRQPPILYN